MPLQVRVVLEEVQDLRLRDVQGGRVYRRSSAAANWLSRPESPMEPTAAGRAELRVEMDAEETWLELGGRGDPGGE